MGKHPRHFRMKQMLLCPILCPPPNPTDCYRLSAASGKSFGALHL